MGHERMCCLAQPLLQFRHLLLQPMDDARGQANVDAAKTSITPLGATCGSCHTKYRDRMDDGTFRLKAGSK